MEYVTLSNGIQMPILGYGVYQVTKDECQRCVEDALKVGYRILHLTLILCVVIALTACGSNAARSAEPTPVSVSAAPVEETPQPASEQSAAQGEKDQAMPVDMEETGWTKSIPQEYFAPSSQPGSVVSLDYQTRDYVGDSSDITKTVFIYLPYGYNPSDTETRYNTLYLMHGWGGHEGEYFEFDSQKHLFDNLMEKGDTPPLIIVSPSFYHDDSERDFSSSITGFRAFHNEFENDLMPAVEGAYHTWAASTSDEDLRASRDHRAFGGFSLGSVTTWLQFCHDYDYIRYFLPMSGSCWYYGTYGDFQIERNVDYIQQLVEENDLADRGYFIYHAVGTNDAVKSQSIDMAEEMLSRDTFTPEHYLFYQKDGGYHDFDAVQEYLYNALPLYFR